MIQRICIIILFTFCLTGCSTTKPSVWKAQDVSFANFLAFDILVFNRTQIPDNNDIVPILTAYFKEHFEMQHLLLSDSRQIKKGVLVVQNDFLGYGYPLIGTSKNRTKNNLFQCKLFTRLIDKSINKVVAEITTNTGISIIGSPNDDIKEKLLKKSAAVVTREVKKLMELEKTGPGDSIWQKI